MAGPGDIPGINTDLGELGAFSDKLAEESTAMFTGVQDITQAATADMPKLGRGGMLESNYAVQMQMARFGDLTEFLGEVSQGSRALSDAAKTIAINYNGSDIESAATVNGVNDAFTPAAAPAGAAQPDAAAVAKADADLRASGHGQLPTAKDPTATPDRLDNSGQSAAQERVMENRNEYMGMQDWNPDDRPTVLAPGPMDGSGPTSSSGTLA